MTARPWAARRRLLLGVAAAAALALGGCSTPTDDTPSAKPPASGGATSTSSPTATGAPRRLSVSKTIDAAELRTLDPLEVTEIDRFPVQQGGTLVSVQGVTTDGQPLIVRSSEKAAQDPASFESLSLGDGTVLARPEAGRFKPTKVVGGERFVVWQESSSSQLASFPFSIWMYDRRTGKSERIHSSALIEGAEPPPVPGYTGPVLDGDSVVWAQISGTQSDPTVDILRCEIVDCQPEVTIPDAALPSVVNGTVYGVGFSEGRNSDVVVPGEAPPEDASAGEVQFKEVRSGGAVTTTATIQVEGGPTGYVTNGRQAVLTGQRDGQAVALLIDDTDVTEVAGSDRLKFGYPVVGSNFFAWAETSGSSNYAVAGYAWEPGASEVSTVGNATGLYAIEAASDYVLYQERRDDEVVFVVAEISR